MKLGFTSQTIMAACVTVGALGASFSAHAQAVFPAPSALQTPLTDAFYKAPANLTSYALGEVIRYRPFTAKEYNSSEVKQAYHVMYRSNGQKGQPAAFITSILIPPNAALINRKLLSYHSFYDSLTLTCTPSYLSTKGRLFEGDFVKPALTEGHIVVLPDYEGLDSQWIAGKNTAQGVLDGIRAAINFQPAGLKPNARVAMMGFSGGGHATAWAAEMASTYAPELNIVGAAIGGVPVNIANVARKVDGGLFSGVFLAAVTGLSRAYPEIDKSVYATAEGLKALDDIGDRCLLGIFEGHPDFLLKYGFKKSTTYLKDGLGFLDKPQIKAIIDENNLGQKTPNMPVLVVQGLLDEIMPTADVNTLVKGYCDAGVQVQYKKTYSDHVLTALAQPTTLRNFALDRLNGKAFTSKTCN